MMYCFYEISIFGSGNNVSCIRAYRSFDWTVTTCPCLYRTLVHRKDSYYYQTRNPPPGLYIAGGGGDSQHFYIYSSHAVNARDVPT